MMNGWHNVNRLEKCPICGHDSWCSVSDDGNVCVCRRTPSPHPTKSGNGWIHQLKDNPQQFTPRPIKSAAPTIDVAKHFAALPTGDIQIRLCRYLMREIGLPADMMLAMDVRWDNAAKAAAFPMRNPAGEITGLRYRQLKTGKKWSLKGSKDGLFYIPEFFNFDRGELVVCEGPTDMLAAASCGVLNIVGRSSCMTGAQHLREMARQLNAKRITIVADFDAPKERPDGSTWRPGIDGANKLAADLGLAYRIMFPANPFKDLRDWYSKGAMTLEKFTTLAESATWKVHNEN